MATGKVAAIDLLNGYKDYTRRIFTKKSWYEFPKLPLYNRVHFRNLWSEMIGDDFRMGDVKTKLMVTTVNTVYDEWGSEQTRFFKSWHDDDANLKLVDVVCNSFAAPIYFGHVCDPVRKRVYSDGGCGYYNLPLDETKLQAETFGWYTAGNTLSINAIGCLYWVDPTKRSFATVCKENTLKQFLGFAKPLSGGMSRSMSQSDQIRKMTYLCKNTPSIQFKYWDCRVPNKKMDAMDSLKYLNTYETFGWLMASKPLISLNA
jgi:hypothetical protein